LITLSVIAGVGIAELTFAGVAAAGSSWFGWSGATDTAFSVAGYIRYLPAFSNLADSELLKVAAALAMAGGGTLVCFCSGGYQCIKYYCCDMEVEDSEAHQSLVASAADDIIAADTTAKVTTPPVTRIISASVKNSFSQTNVATQEDLQKLYDTITTNIAQDPETQRKTLVAQGSAWLRSIKVWNTFHLKYSAPSSSDNTAHRMFSVLQEAFNAAKSEGGVKAFSTLLAKLNEAEQLFSSNASSVGSPKPNKLYNYSPKKLVK